MGDSAGGQEQRGSHCSFTGERFRADPGRKLRAEGQALEIGVVAST